MDLFRWQLYLLFVEIVRYDIDSLPEILLREAKTLGFSDEQIVRIMKDGSIDEDVYEKRKQLGITRVFKMVDTCSAEFEAKTPYFYSTFEFPPLPPPKGKNKELILSNESISKTTYRGIASREAYPFGGEFVPVDQDSRGAIIILGSGPNRIGQGIEFDYCCVHGLLAIKECGYEPS